MTTGKKESHYKILGTTAKIGQGRIKEKYIEAVKKYPPEVEPEKFEEIREAYEILKDPIKRREYDFFRKYGNKVEKIVNKAINYFENDDTVAAQRLYEEALRISPNDPSSLFGLIQIALRNDEIQMSRKYFQDFLTSHTDQEELRAIYSIYANILMEEGYPEAAIVVLEEASQVFSTDSLQFHILRALVYMQLGDNKRAWRIFQEETKNADEQGIEYSEFYITWLHCLLRTEEWGQKDALQKQFRRFVKQLDDEEDCQEMYEMMMDEYEMLYHHHHYVGAEIAISLAKIVAQGDKDIQEMHQEVKKLAQVEKDIGRLEKDQQAFPLLFINALEWFLEDSEKIHHAINQLPHGILDAFMEDKEEYAAGILYVKKKYPFLYKTFKKQWDNKFAELTEGFNREMKRMLNKMK